MTDVERECSEPLNNGQTMSGDGSDQQPVRLFEYYSIFSVSLLSLSSGTIFGWISPTMLAIHTARDTSYNIPESNVVLIPTILIATGLISPAIVALTLNRLGRKRTMLLTAFLMIVAHVILIVARAQSLFFTATIILGISTALTFAVPPVYIAEIATPRLRGLFLATLTVQKNAGILVAYFVVPLVDIRVNSALVVTLPVITFICLAIIAESPHFYLFKREQSRAFKSLAKLKSMTHARGELKRINDAMCAANRSTNVKLLIEYKRALFVNLFLIVSRDLSGITALTVYSQILFSDAHADPWTCGVILGCVTILGAIVSACLIDYGRKRLLIASTILAAVSLIALTYTSTCAPQLSPIFLVTYKFVFSCGADSVPFILTSESFPVHVKNAAMFIVNVAGCVCALACINVFNYARVHVGVNWCYAFMAVYCAGACVVYAAFVQETKCKTLEDIQNKR